MRTKKETLSRKEIEKLELEYLRKTYGDDSPEVKDYKEVKRREFNNRVSEKAKMVGKGALAVGSIVLQGAILAGIVTIGVKVLTGGKKD